MTIREQLENKEKDLLSPLAKLSVDTAGRKIFEEPCNLRTCFQRDRDRIIHSKSFRRLKHKTQVFLSPESDHYRTRLTHTLEVSQIARTIARALSLNEDLTEAIALGHDLGHTPFGHAGERAIDKLATFKFTHFQQSVRVCEAVEKKGMGLNLTAEVLNGILCHTAGIEATTLEGRIIRFADKIAYINHDIDDAIRAGIISADDLPREAVEYLGNSKSARINAMVTSVVNNSAETIKMDEQTHKCYLDLHKYLFEAVYTNQKAKGEEEKVGGIISALFEFFMANPDKLSVEYQNIAERDGVERAVVDYISGMTDHFAVYTYENIFVPKFWNL